jgi:hypothetical protein
VVSEGSGRLRVVGRTGAFDRRALADLVRRQNGVITRGQAIGCSMTDAMVRYRIRPDGPWQVILPGVYLTATGRLSADQRRSAAQIYAGPGAAITGPEALAWHGIRAPGTQLIDMLVPADHRPRDAGFVRIRRTTAMPRFVLPERDICYVPPARAVADTVYCLPETEEVRAVVAAAVQRGKVLPAHLAEELKNGPVRGSARLRHVLAEIADGVRSVAEGDLRALVRRERLPEPAYNARLYVGDEFLASPDAWWQEAALAAEVDSREWHLSPADWERTLARHARMSALGIVVLHYPPRRLRAEPRRVAAEIRQAIEAGRGREVPRLTVRPAR